MRIFSFGDEFEIIVNLPKQETFERYYNYLVNKNMEISIKDEKNYIISYKTSLSLFSLPVEFTINFNEITSTSTKLYVKSSSSPSLDLGRSKALVNDITKEIYNIELNTKSFTIFKITTISILALSILMLIII